MNTGGHIGLLGQRPSTTPAAPPAIRVTTTTRVVPAPGGKQSASANLPQPTVVAPRAVTSVQRTPIIAPKPVKAQRPSTISPPPAKRARTDSLDPPARLQPRETLPAKPKKAPVDRVVALNVVSPPPSRSVSPISRAKYIPRADVAAVDADVDTLLPHIEAADIVRDGLKEYEPFFHDVKDPTRTPLEWSGTDVPAVDLEYPMPGAKERFALMWPKPQRGDRLDLWDPIKEIMQTVILILECYLTPEESIDAFEYEHGSKNAGLPLPTMSIVGAMERAISRRDGPGFLVAVERFNAKMREVKQAGAFAASVRLMPGVEERLWRHICGQAYDRAVGPRTDSLKVYESWSSNVYGELLPAFVADILHVTGLGPGKVCVDLGSGVGNCLIQASLASGCESHGFEIMPAASYCATLQVDEAHARWQMWGLKGGDVYAVKADFVKEADLVMPIIKKADVIICNNFVYTAELNGDIVQLLLDAKDGAQVVHLKPFAPATTERSLDSPAAILRQGAKRRWGRHYVSWTDVEGEYYISIVDREAYNRRVREARERSTSRPASRNA